MYGKPFRARFSVGRMRCFVWMALLPHARRSVLAVGPYRDPCEGSGLCFVHAVSSTSFKPAILTHALFLQASLYTNKWLP